MEIRPLQSEQKKVNDQPLSISKIILHLQYEVKSCKGRRLFAVSEIQTDFLLQNDTSANIPLKEDRIIIASCPFEKNSKFILTQCK
jgi:hypothetical protein